MDTLQFTLFFAALLIGYVLIHLRLVRFEKYLREVSALRVVNERLNGVAEALTRVNLDRVEDRLEMIHAELGALVEISGRLEQAVARSREQAAVANQAAGPTVVERIRDLVETRLLSLGYRNLRILTDLSSVAFADEVEITVECQKNQMIFKGKVVTGNGEIRDVDLQSVARSFP